MFVVTGERRIELPLALRDEQERNYFGVTNIFNLDDLLEANLSE